MKIKMISINKTDLYTSNVIKKLTKKFNKYSFKKTQFKKNWLKRKSWIRPFSHPAFIKRYAVSLVQPIPPKPINGRLFEIKRKFK